MMAEAETPTSPTPRDPVRVRLDRLVVGARAAGLIERIWPLLWRGLMVVLAFLTLSWLGLWLELPQVWRMVGLGLFALVAVVVLAPMARLRSLDRRQALARIDREAARTGKADGALSHDPASAIEDTLAVGSNDPATKALWALHQRRAAAAVARLRIGAPRPDMPRHDPLALRAGFVVAAIAALFVAGPEWRERIGAAFDWREPPLPGPNFRVDGWIDPPLYTRLPPLIVTMSRADAGKGGEQHLRAPVNSTLIVRIAGHGEATLTPNAALEPISKDAKGDAGTRKAPPAGVSSKTAQSDLREERFRLGAGTAELKIKTEGAPPQRLTIESIPDRPPEVERVGGLDVNGRGTFNLTYRAKDDYGIASAEGIVEPLKPGRSLVPVPKLNLALPADATGAAETKTLIDLTDNPWSGARMRLSLVVKDEAGQEGRTQAAEITLPARPFIQPLARSLAEERRRLVTAPDDDRKRVQIALDALLIAPEHFTPQPSIFLGLKTAAGRLRAAKSDEDLTAVADLLWEMALKIEDGDLSDAEKSLRAAQDRLKEAMDRGAPDEEIKKLTDDLKKALDRFMKEFAERQNKDQKNGQQKQSEQQQQGKQKTVTPDQLQKMIQDMQEAMKRGDTAEAQRLLEQLRGILENLQSAQNGQKQGQQQSQMNKQMQELDQMSRDQQKLRDQTFKESQEQQGRPRQNKQQQGQQQGQKGQQQQGQKGSQGQQGQGQQQEGQQGQNGGESGKGDTGQQQQALREQLQELQRRMKEQGLEGEQGLSDAEQAMKEAEDALGRGQGDQAVDAQGRALDGLKKGAEGMQQQMQQQAEAEGQGQQDGENPGQQGQAGAADDDPLGRPTKGRDLSNGNVRVPNADESAVQRARRIMEELRRKLGDPTRPQEELDYFERLLRRN
ncbi:uncharacterized protein (TIGR02302 family) [Methylobacterium brachythecii]|uniref:Uncharacterized protein (TIGR02302 family) n=2 Tax=Methylobacterium brachythecii TaxID=1176177 RepID=A0A7W6AJF0_9HYPH|nr:uncharacterized protein (TIGR02302 family) [Methylobacterium brachythecii]